MLRKAARFATGLALAVIVAIGAVPAAQAADNLWRIAKVSGEAWVSGSGVQPASAAQQAELRPGDSIRTGRNGRVLLVRGAESILISANSAISLPEAGRPGMSTVIQQAGSILLEVEKRNVQHFEVETPYLAAVVKGTRFSVSLQGGQAKVDVVRGQVQVSDFRSGQFALVLPGQSARASFGQVPGLQLSGQGTLARVEQGTPQAARVAPLAVPGGGLRPAPGATPLLRGAAPVLNEVSDRRRPAPSGIVRGPNGALRISAPLGEVKLDIHKVTRGMARSEAQANGQAPRRATVWNTGELNPGNGGNKNNVGNSGSAVGGTEAAGAGAGVASTASGTAGTGSASANAANGQGIAQSAGNRSNSSVAGSSSSGNSSNSNAGGNGNGKSSSSNAGGNGNGNSSNSNAGGNGDGNALGLAKNGNGNGNSKKD
ncbi:FecR family protein [Bosea sp. LjRoot9]|uniref:FecR domain-containing protein n=1 Tax=Bosea sp. LjRoot9 TaxID=3342341 RepID=UPI003ED0BF6A